MPPCSLMHVRHLTKKLFITAWRVETEIAAIVSRMDCFSSFKFVGFPLKTCCLQEPHKKKSSAIRLSDLGVQRNVEFLDISLLGNVHRNSVITGWAM